MVHLFINFLLLIFWDAKGATVITLSSNWVKAGGTLVRSLVHQWATHQPVRNLMHSLFKTIPIVYCGQKQRLQKTLCDHCSLVTNVVQASIGHLLI